MSSGVESNAAKDAFEAASQEKERNPAAAVAAYRQAMALGDPEWSPAAAVQLGDLLRKQGDIAGAREAYEAAVASGHSDWAPAASYGLGNLLFAQGDADGARRAYQQAIDSGNPKASAMASFNLGRLLARSGDAAGARAAYQRVVDSRDPTWGPRAWTAINDMNRKPLSLRAKLLPRLVIGTVVALAFIGFGIDLILHSGAHPNAPVTCGFPPQPLPAGQACVTTDSNGNTTRESYAQELKDARASSPWAAVVGAILILLGLSSGWRVLLADVALIPLGVRAIFRRGRPPPAPS